MADKNKPGDYFNRPEKLGAWAGFKQFMYNSEEGSFMGRTGGSWGKCHTLTLHIYAFMLRSNLSSDNKISLRQQKYAIQIFPLDRERELSKKIYFTIKYSQ